MKRHPLRAFRDLGTGNGNEVTEPVEVPVHILSKRDENQASKDIAESPTALPERPKERLQVNKTTRLQDYKKIGNSLL